MRPSEAITKGLESVRPNRLVWLTTDTARPDDPRTLCGCAGGILLVGAGQHARLLAEQPVMLGSMVRELVNELYPDVVITMPDGIESFEPERLGNALDWLFSHEGWPLEDVLGWLEGQGL